MQDQTIHPDQVGAVAPSDSAQPRTAPDATGLTDIERAVLDLENGWWKYAGVKESRIREEFGWSSTRYYQVLNSLLDRPEAMAYAPLTVKRLVRLRGVRQARRSAARLRS